MKYLKLYEELHFSEDEKIDFDWNDFDEEEIEPVDICTIYEVRDEIYGDYYLSIFEYYKRYYLIVSINEMKKYYRKNFFSQHKKIININGYDISVLDYTNEVNDFHSVSSNAITDIKKDIIRINNDYGGMKSIDFRYSDLKKIFKKIKFN